MHRDRKGSNPLLIKASRGKWNRYFKNWTLICDYSLNLGSILLKLLIVDYKLSIYNKNTVYACDSGKHFVSSRLHLPHGVGEEEPTATFCQINNVNINGVKWKLKNTAYLIFLYITDGVLLVLYRRNEWSQFVGVLIAK